MRVLALAAWAVFLVDAAGTAWLAGEGLSASDPLGRSIALGVAELFALPLLVLFAVLGLSTWRRSRIGLWICLALGVSPIILVICNMVRNGS